MFTRSLSLRQSPNPSSSFHLLDKIQENRELKKVFCFHRHLLAQWKRVFLSPSSSSLLYRRMLAAEAFVLPSPQVRSTSSSLSSSVPVDPFFSSTPVYFPFPPSLRPFVHTTCWHPTRGDVSSSTLWDIHERPPRKRPRKRSLFPSRSPVEGGGGRSATPRLPSSVFCARMQWRLCSHSLLLLPSAVGRTADEAAWNALLVSLQVCRADPNYWKHLLATLTESSEFLTLERLMETWIHRTPPLCSSSSSSSAMGSPSPEKLYYGIECMNAGRGGGVSFWGRRERIQSVEVADEEDEEVEDLSPATSEAERRGLALRGWTDAIHTLTPSHCFPLCAPPGAPSPHLLHRQQYYITLTLFTRLPSVVSSTSIHLSHASRTHHRPTPSAATTAAAGVVEEINLGRCEGVGSNRGGGLSYHTEGSVTKAFQTVMGMGVHTLESMLVEHQKKEEKKRNVLVTSPTENHEEATGETKARERTWITGNTEDTVPTSQHSEETEATAIEKDTLPLSSSSSSAAPVSVRTTGEGVSSTKEDSTNVVAPASSPSVPILSHGELALSDTLTRIQQQNAFEVPDVGLMWAEIEYWTQGRVELICQQEAMHKPSLRLAQLMAGYPGDVEVFTRITALIRNASHSGSGEDEPPETVRNEETEDVEENSKIFLGLKYTAESPSWAQRMRWWEEHNLEEMLQGRADHAPRGEEEETSSRYLARDTQTPLASKKPPTAAISLDAYARLHIRRYMQRLHYSMASGQLQGPLVLIMEAVCGLYSLVCTRATAFSPMHPNRPLLSAGPSSFSILPGREPQRTVRSPSLRPTWGHYGWSRSGMRRHEGEIPFPLLSVHRPETREGIDFLLFSWFGSAPQLRSFDIQPHRDREQFLYKGRRYDTMARAMLFYDIVGSRLLFAESHHWELSTAVRRVHELAVLLNMPREDFHTRYSTSPPRAGHDTSSFSSSPSVPSTSPGSALSMLQAAVGTSAARTRLQEAYPILHVAMTHRHLEILRWSSGLPRQSSSSFPVLATSSSSSSSTPLSISLSQFPYRHMNDLAFGVARQDTLVQLVQRAVWDDHRSGEARTVKGGRRAGERMGNDEQARRAMGVARTTITNAPFATSPRMEDSTPTTTEPNAPVLHEATHTRTPSSASPSSREGNARQSRRAAHRWLRYFIRAQPSQLVALLSVLEGLGNVTFRVVSEEEEEAATLHGEAGDRMAPQRRWQRSASNDSKEEETSSQVEEERIAEVATASSSLAAPLHEFGTLLYRHGLLHRNRKNGWNGVAELIFHLRKPIVPRTASSSSRVFSCRHRVFIHSPTRPTHGSPAASFLHPFSSFAWNVEDPHGSPPREGSPSSWTPQGVLPAFTWLCQRALEQVYHTYPSLADLLLPLDLLFQTAMEADPLLPTTLRGATSNTKEGALPLSRGPHRFPMFCPTFYTPPVLLGQLLRGVCGKYQCHYALVPRASTMRASGGDREDRRRSENLHEIGKGEEVEEGTRTATYAPTSSVDGMGKDAHEEDPAETATVLRRGWYHSGSTSVPIETARQRSRDENGEEGPTRGIGEPESRLTHAHTPPPVFYARLHSPSLTTSIAMGRGGSDATREEERGRGDGLQAKGRSFMAASRSSTPPLQTLPVMEYVCYLSIPFILSRQYQNHPHPTASPRSSSSATAFASKRKGGKTTRTMKDTTAPQPSSSDVAQPFLLGIGYGSTKRAAWKAAATHALATNFSDIWNHQLPSWRSVCHDVLTSPPALNRLYAYYERHEQGSTRRGAAVSHSETSNTTKQDAAQKREETGEERETSTKTSETPMVVITASQAKDQGHRVPHGCASGASNTTAYGVVFHSFPPSGTSSSSFSAWTSPSLFSCVATPARCRVPLLSPTSSSLDAVPRTSSQGCPAVWAVGYGASPGQAFAAVATQLQQQARTLLQDASSSTLVEDPAERGTASPISFSSFSHWGVASHCTKSILHGHCEYLRLYWTAVMHPPIRISSSSSTSSSVTGLPGMQDLPRDVGSSLYSWSPFSFDSVQRGGRFELRYIRHAALASPSSTFRHVLASALEVQPTSTSVNPHPSSTSSLRKGKGGPSEPPNGPHQRKTGDEITLVLVQRSWYQSTSDDPSRMKAWDTSSVESSSRRRSASGKEWKEEGRIAVRTTPLIYTCVPPLPPASTTSLAFLRAEASLKGLPKHPRTSFLEGGRVDPGRRSEPLGAAPEEVVVRSRFTEWWKAIHETFAALQASLQELEEPEMDTLRKEVKNEGEDEPEPHHPSSIPGTVASSRPSFSSLVLHPQFVAFQSVFYARLHGLRYCYRFAPLHRCQEMLSLVFGVPVKMVQTPVYTRSSLEMSTTEAREKRRATNTEDDAQEEEGNSTVSSVFPTPCGWRVVLLARLPLLPSPFPDPTAPSHMWWTMGWAETRIPHYSTKEDGRVCTTTTTLQASSKTRSSSATSPSGKTYVAKDSCTPSRGVMHGRGRGGKALVEAALVAAVEAFIDQEVLPSLQVGWKPCSPPSSLFVKRRKAEKK